MIPATAEREEDAAHFGARKGSAKFTNIVIYLSIMLVMTGLAIYSPDLGELPFVFLIFAFLIDLLFIVLILMEFNKMLSANRFRFGPAGFAPPALPFPYSRQAHGFVDFRTIGRIQIYIVSRKYHIALMKGTTRYDVTSELVGEALFNEFMDYIITRPDLNPKVALKIRQGDGFSDASVPDRKTLDAYRDGPGCA
jgi:hypothetical protein